MRVDDFPDDVVLHSRVTVNNLVAKRNHIAYLSDSVSVLREVA